MFVRRSPGLISAAASNDPTTVATLAIVGTSSGYELCWVVVLAIAMLAVVQATAAAVGAASRTSLQGAIVKRFGLRWGIVTLLAVVAVNAITLAADVKAGAEAMSLLTGFRSIVFVLPFVAAVALLLVTHSFNRIGRVLQLLPIAFLGYAGSAIVARFDVPALVQGMFVPHAVLSIRELSMIVAVLGTTLTSYVYMWESIEIAQQRPSASAVGSYQRDAIAGMLLVGAIFMFIVVASAATTGRYHLHVETARDLAAALTPLAGPWAGTLFGVGLLGSAILVVPILASTNAYVVSHTLGWEGDLNSALREAPGFYTVLLGSLALGGMVAFAPVAPIALLYWASIAAGFATPITLYFLIRVGSDRAAMQGVPVGAALASSGWIVGAAVSVACAVFLFTAAVSRAAG